MHTRTHRDQKLAYFLQKEKKVVWKVLTITTVPPAPPPLSVYWFASISELCSRYNTSTNPQIRTQSQNLACVKQFPVSRTTNGGKLVLQHANTHQNVVQTQNTHSNHSPSDKNGAQFGHGMFFSKLNSNFELNFNDRLWNSEDFISKN